MQQDPAYLLIKRWMSQSDQDTLFEHTRHIRKVQEIFEKSQQSEPSIRTSRPPGPHLRRGWPRGLDDESRRSNTSEEERIALPKVHYSASLFAMPAPVSWSPVCTKLISSTERQCELSDSGETSRP